MARSTELTAVTWRWDNHAIEATQREMTRRIIALSLTEAGIRLIQLVGLIGVLAVVFVVDVSRAWAFGISALIVALELADVILARWARALVRRRAAKRIVAPTLSAGDRRLVTVNIVSILVMVVALACYRIESEQLRA